MLGDKNVSNVFPAKTGFRAHLDTTIMGMRMHWAKDVAGETPATATGTVAPPKRKNGYRVEVRLEAANHFNISAGAVSILSAMDLGMGQADILPACSVTQTTVREPRATSTGGVEPRLRKMKR